MKSRGDKESPWNTPQLIFTSPRLVSPNTNSVFQSIIVDLRSAVTLGAAPTSFKVFNLKP